jgi:hypothetical protein
MSDLITLPRATVQQALEALEGGGDSWRLIDPAIDALKAALAEEALQRLTDVHQELEAALEQPNECRWLQEGDEESDTWAASCGRHRYFSLNEGTPKDNHMRHCCYCGKPLVEVPIEEEEK